MTTQPQVDLRIIKPEEIFQYWQVVSTSDAAKRHSIEDLSWQFGKVASGELSSVGFFRDQELSGLVIFETKQFQRDGRLELHAITRQIWAPRNARQFLPMLMAKLKEWGYTKLGGGTTEDGKTMARLFGFKILYTYIEKEL